MIQTILLFLAGLFFLIRGGDYFVSSSVKLAGLLGIPRLIIGGTLVSIATTLPELMVTATASFQGDAHLAIGNALGSVIANTGLVVGFSAVVRAIWVRPRDFLVSAWVMLGAAFLLSVFLIDGYFPRWGGLIMLGAGAFYLTADLIRNYRLNKKSQNPSPSGGKGKAVGKNLIFFALGALLVVAGSRLLVNSSLQIAAYFNFSTLFVGLTIIALGTSLPELTTAIVAMRRGVADLSLGNVVGANILGLTWVAGLAGTISPFSLDRTGDILSLLGMLIFVVLLLIMGFTQSRISRKEGLILLTLYLFYLLGAYQVGFLIN